MLPIDTSASVSQIKDSYLDPNSLDPIKAMGRDRDPQALKEVAKKFEALFVQQMLKSMREANDVFGEGNYFDSQSTRFHRDMLDQQMVLNLTSGSGIGLADHFYKQMMQNYGAGMNLESDSAVGNSGELAMPVAHKQSQHTTADEIATDGLDSGKLDSSKLDSSELDGWVNEFMRMSDNSDLRNILSETENERAANEAHIQQAFNYLLTPALLAKPQYTRATGGQKASISTSQENFVMMLKPHAEKAAAELNINPDVLIAQVALETGWGKHVIHDKQGANSFNLFNIKAGSQWQGAKVNVSTLEYRDGIAANEKADFRKYSDYAESFSDYVQLMKNNSRYERVLEAGTNSSAYAEALQSAGYATDPFYAKKIKQLLNSDAFKILDDVKPLGDINLLDDAKALHELSGSMQSVLSLAAGSRQLVE